MRAVESATLEDEGKGDDSKAWFYAAVGFFVLTVGGAIFFLLR